MKKLRRKIRKKFFPLFDLIFAPFIYPAALLLKKVRRKGIENFPLCRKALLHVGIFPIKNNYYEPMFDSSSLRYPLSDVRNLPGINWNEDEQIEILSSFSFIDDLKKIPLSKKDDLTFYINNSSYGPGDAEYWYNMIRQKKPSIIIEIGSGNSTLMAMKALEDNKRESPGYQCEYICIDPYGKWWLEKLDVTIYRKGIEEVENSFFQKLGENDILFIDSSHMIRPQGDVLFEYLEILPTLKQGVIVHIHDIFSPRDYLEDWIRNKVVFWNEQYLLEAFLTLNPDWKIIGALNYLHNDHFDKLKAVCPFLLPETTPGAFYIQRVDH